MAAHRKEVQGVLLRLLVLLLLLLLVASATGHEEDEGSIRGGASIHRKQNVEDGRVPLEPGLPQCRRRGGVRRRPLDASGAQARKSVGSLFVV